MGLRRGPLARETKSSAGEGGGGGRAAWRGAGKKTGSISNRDISLFAHTTSATTRLSSRLSRGAWPYVPAPMTEPLPARVSQWLSPVPTLLKKAETPYGNLWSYISLCLAGTYMGSPCGSAGKESACNVRDLGSIPGLGNTLEKGKAIHSSILAWRIPWTV